MRKIFLTPLVRVSFGLAMLTVSLLFVSELLGLVPDKRAGELESRRVIAQSLAVQLSAAISHNAASAIEETLNSVIEWNDSILSAAIRPSASNHIYQFGDHTKNWTLKPDDKSTATQIQVAVYDQEGRWGTMEVRFAPLGGQTSLESFKDSNLALVLFIAIVAFISYMFFLKRVVVELNTDNVIPNRVRSALDSLTESLLIIDKSGLIVFSNNAFSTLTGLSSEEIIGKTTTDYLWDFDTTRFENQETPWDGVLDEGLLLQGELIKLRTENDMTFHLTVNATPVLSTDDSIQGALITFNDITEIENKNEQLRNTLRKLEEAQEKVTLQNERLQILATRDPMTNVLNRRSLFEQLDQMFERASTEKTPLSFIMVDIDHFKSVNDTYGHATGDRVIVFLANCLTKHGRPDDLVARFGGEEFCLVLPETEIEEAAVIAENIRIEVEQGHGGDYIEDLKITASLGVSVLSDEVSNPNGLFELADQALYKAKESGRNQVVSWSEELSEEKSLAPVSVRQNSENGSDNSIATVDHQQDETSNSPAIVHIDNAIGMAAAANNKLAVMILEVDILYNEQTFIKDFDRRDFNAEIIKRYSTLIRDTDTLLNGDDNKSQSSMSQLSNHNLILLLTELDEVESVELILERIYRTTENAITLDKNTFRTTTNVGISTYPEDGNCAVSLLKNACIAKREALRAPGENNHVFYASIATQIFEDEFSIKQVESHSQSQFK